MYFEGLIMLVRREYVRQRARMRAHYALIAKNVTRVA
jgi:hypothetical protein